LIIFDTETTGLPVAKAAGLAAQPEIIEYAAVKVNDDLEVIDEIEFMCRPRIMPLDPVITKITGIKTADLEDKLPFNAYLSDLVKFHFAQSEILAHNVAFDIDLMSFELQRLNAEFRFPWPPIQICTVEATRHLKNNRLKLAELFEMATGSPPAKAHRAMDDVMSLLTVVRWLKKEGIPL
jgi:DNA polymerase III epsilon subunit-like protein